MPTWPADIARLRSEYFTSEDQLATLRLFDLYPSADLWEFARREGLWVSSEMGSHIDNVADVLADLNAKGLLTSEHAFNHCNALPEKSWELIKSSGAAVNLAPRSDAAFGLGSGFPPVDQARAAGIVPGLSGDNEVSYGLSMFTEMQMLLRSTAAASSAVSWPASRTRRNSCRPRTYCGSRRSAAPPTRACPARSAP